MTYIRGFILLIFSIYIVIIYGNLLNIQGSWLD